MNELLYGTNDEQRIVAVHPASDHSMRVYERSSNGVSFREIDFYPFFFLSNVSYLKEYPAKHWIKELTGTNYFRYLCAFTSWSDMWDAIRFVLDRYNRESSTKVESFSELPVLHIRPDAVSQFFLQTGRTLFKGMEFDQLHRLQLDIETYTKPGHRFSSAQRLEDRIIIIALSDNRGWEHAITAEEKSEKDMLTELVQIIRERDPDVVEGHNIYNFDLPYILDRCALHGVELAIGRDGSALRSFDSRMSFAERPVDYTAHEIAGRHIIDTWLLLQSYDVSKRTLESYSLKYAAQHFGFAKKDRVYIPHERIPWYWDTDRQSLIRYALDDVEETRLLSDYLSHSVFYMTQMLPFNYGTVARIGSSAKIESLLLREYIRQRASVPKPVIGAQTTGGYTDVFYTGIMGPIINVDVESLYPSIMVKGKIRPETEMLAIFPALLEALTGMRLDAKRRMQATTGQRERTKLDALQSSFKTLINSFYGYLGYNRALFNDIEAADRVTQTGQKILRQLIASIGKRGGSVVEVDTDGIYFVPPSDVTTIEAEQQFVSQLASELPAGINLAVSGRFARMVSYKKKNYALLDYDGKVKIKGSSLISRSLEKFGRQFIEQCLHAMLHEDIERFHKIYVDFRTRILEHNLTVADIARVETLKDTLEQYTSAIESGGRNRMASYETAIASGMKWKPGDRIAYYITGSDGSVRGFENCKLADEWDPNFPDENVQYYLRRLDEIAEKFSVFFTPSDFRAIFSVDDLFGFSAQGIRIVTAPTSSEAIEREDEETDSPEVHPRIWIDR